MIDPASFSQQLVAVTRSGLDKNNAAQSSRVNEKVRAFKALDKKVDTLSDALKDLTKNSDLRATDTKLSVEGIVKASTSDGAVVGDYSIEVSHLAQASRIGVSFSDDKWQVPHAGKLTFTVGNNTPPTAMELDLSDPSVLSDNANLVDLRNAINSAEDNPGVQASIIRTGSDVKLVLSSTETGTEHALTMNYAADNPTPPATASADERILEDAFNGQVELSAAKNAELKFNGIDITSQSNEIKNITDNLTLELTKTTKPDEPLTLTVGRDDDAITKSLESLVSAYNGLVGRVKTSTVSKVETGETKVKTRPALSGDSTASSMMRQLRSVFTHLPEGSYLGQVGLKFDKNGEISLDKKALAKSLDNDPDVLNHMLMGNKDLGELVDTSPAGIKNRKLAEDGIVDRLSAMLKPYSKSDGLFDKRVSSLNSELDRLTDKTAQLDLQMESLYKRYLKQFTAMQQLESQMQQTSGLFGVGATQQF